MADSLVKAEPIEAKILVDPHLVEGESVGFKKWKY